MPRGFKIELLANKGINPNLESGLEMTWKGLYFELWRGLFHFANHDPAKNHTGTQLRSRQS